MSKLTTDELEHLYSLESDGLEETIAYNRTTGVWQNGQKRPVRRGPSQFGLELERRGVERFTGYSESWKS